MLLCLRLLLFYALPVCHHNDQYTQIHISPTSNEADTAAADAACNVPQVALVNKGASAEG